MNNKLFPIGFWNTADAVKFGTEGVKDWKDFGATLTFTGFYNYNPDRDKMTAILDECYKCGIDIIFVDQRTEAQNTDDLNFDALINKNISDFGNHPAVRGFFVCDEPRGKLVDAAAKEIGIYKERCPQKEPIVNLLPWMPPDRNPHSLLISDSDENYSNRIVDFIKRTQIKHLMFDCYVQFQDRQPNEFWVGAYFKNLNMFKKAATDAGVDLWFTGLATGHGGYRCPNQDEFRWQISTAVAHGAKGLFYWFMYAEPYNVNYRCHPINQFGERTDTFRWLSTENRIFQMIYGALFNELTLQKAYHIHKAYGGTDMLDENSDKYISEVRSYDEHDGFVPAIISRFTRENDDRIYYALVNNSTEAPTATYVKFKKDVTYFTCQDNWEKIMVTNRGLRKAGDEERFWCSPGQIWVFAVKETEAD